MSRAHHGFGLVALVMLCASVATAQDLNAEARAAAAEGRLVDADRLLSESLRADPSASTAYNLALVKLNRGRLVEARDLFERILAADFGELPEERRSVVTQRFAEVTARLAVVSIRLTGSVAASVRIDGVVVGSLEPEERTRTEVDPGPHVVRVRSDDGREQEITVELEEGSFQVREIHFDPAPVVERSSPRLRRVLLAVAAVALVAAAASIAIVATRDQGGDPIPEAPPWVLGRVEALSR